MVAQFLFVFLGSLRALLLDIILTSFKTFLHSFQSFSASGDVLKDYKISKSKDQPGQHQPPIVAHAQVRRIRVEAPVDLGDAIVVVVGLRDQYVEQRAPAKVIPLVEEGLAHPIGLHTERTELRRARGRGIALLGALHDDEAIRALEAYRQSETVPELRDAADEAIRTLRAGPPEAPLDDDELRERLQDLEDRMDAMEAATSQGAEE